MLFTAAENTVWKGDSHRAAKIRANGEMTYVIQCFAHCHLKWEKIRTSLVVSNRKLMKDKPKFSHTFLRLLLVFVLGASMSVAYPQSYPEKADSLYHFVENWAGVWIQGDHPVVWDEEPTAAKWVVQLDPKYIVGDQVAVLLSEYYKDGLVDVLWFRFENGGLMYQGATKDGLWMDVSRLDYARLVPVQNEETEILVLELLEAEVENYVYAPMLNMPPESHPGWAWGLQRYLLAFLDGGSYDVLNPRGVPTTLDAAFGRSGVRG